jgi:amino acid adenylation domain-containing protein
VRETSLGAYGHQDVPFELLVQALEAERDMSRSPLFQVMFNYMMNYSAPRVDLPDLTLRLERLHSGAAQFDINVDMWETEDGLNGVIEYCTDLFRHTTITRFITQFRILLENITADPARRLSQYSLLAAEERHRILIEWNDTGVDYQRARCLHELFAEQVTLTPEATAVIFEGRQLSYAELNSRANRLAHYLINQGVRTETLVGISMQRSLEMVVGLLGILKAGAAYVPLDPGYPEERLAYMFDNAQLSVLLTQSELAQRPSAKVICLDTDWSEIEAESDTNPNVPISEANLAYVIYTSGSTGRPKGSMNTHRAISNRLLWMQEQYQLTTTDRVMQKTPFSFDVSVWEFFWPLITGATLVVARPEGHRDSRYLAELIKEQSITTMHFVPSMLRVFLEEAAIDACSSLRQVMSSGEALTYDLVEKFERKFAAKLHNLYGPTEAAVDVSYWECEAEGNRAVPIGRSISNTQLYVLDPWMQPAAIGVIGELYIGGVAVGRGYWRKAALTAERFVPDPFNRDGGARLYRTGDLVRYLSDGNIEYVGRIDSQVKIRGNRIELGEIEAALSEQPGVSEAVVIVKEETPGDARLVGYVVWEAGVETNSAAVREALRRRLPDYMAPAALVTQERMPLSPSGKVDRQALPAPDIGSLVRESTAWVEPETELEKTIAQCLRELLNVERIGLNDDFFDLGGHSLLAAQFLARVRERTGVAVTLKTFFEDSTVGGVAKSVSVIQWVAGALTPDEQAEEPGMILEEGVL